jgi:superfamily II DNA or RNA helicase
MKSILSHRGYSIAKKGVDPATLKKFKSDLTIVPHVEKEEYAFAIKPIKLWSETDKRLYMPRYYGMKVLGEPDTDKLAEQNPEKIDVPIVYEPKEIQKPIVKKVLKDLDEIGGGVMSAYCGAGKCHGRDTPILMYDGTIKMVQDVKVGDQLMGDDSKPRNVLSLARGRETMYRITPKKGDPYIVNESHILSLKITGHKSIHKYSVKGNHIGWYVNEFDHAELSMKTKYFSEKNYGSLFDAKKEAMKYVDTIDTPDIIDIPLKKYLNLPKWYFGRGGYLRGYRVPVLFDEIKVDLDPYMLGYWLGDGSKSDSKITTVEEEVLEYFRNHIKDIDEDLYLRQEPSDPITYSIRNMSTKVNRTFKLNGFMTLLRKYNLLNNKHIPHVYKCNSRKVQLAVLAGLIDSDGSLSHGGYDIIQKRKNLADEIVFLSRSLGFAAYVSECKKTCTNAKNGPKTGTYYRVNIHGKGLEEIPVLLERKKAPPRKQIKDALTVKIDVEKLEEDDYYGFVLDGNHRYLLGDFQVTHNTFMALYICSVLGVKTMIVCHTTSLMQQWVERIQQFLPSARIGIVQQNTAEVEGVDIVIASLKTLAIKNFGKNFFESIGLVVWDEIHLMCTNTFSNAFPKCAVKYTLGLSATPFRKDKCDVIFQHFIGPVLYLLKRPKNSVITAQCITLLVPPDEIIVKHDRRGKIMYTSTLANVLYNKKRTNRLVEMIVDHARKGRKILVLGEYIKHLKEIMKQLIKRETEIHEPIVNEKLAVISKKIYKATSFPTEVIDIIAEYLRDTFGDSAFTYGLYIGEMNNDERKESETKDVILGTYKLASVGMDIPHLNTLLMASPRKEIEQSVGRILRKKAGENEHKPLIIDIIDNHGVFISQARTRKNFYKEYGYTMEHIRMEPVSGKITSKRVVSTSGTTKNEESSKQKTIASFTKKVPFISLSDSTATPAPVPIPNSKVSKQKYEITDDCLLESSSEDN